MRSDWDGKTIKLKPFNGTTAQYARLLVGMSNDLARYIAFANWTCTAGKPCPAACQWQNAPQMIRAIGRQFKAFEAEGIRDANIYSDLIGNDEQHRKLGCASALAILGGDFK
jgi:hypothetical protein